MITRSSQRRSTTASWWLENSTGTPAAARSRSTAEHDVDGDRVQPGERLVEDQQVRVVHQRGRDLHALLVAERERLQLVVGPVGQLQLVEQACGVGAWRSPWLSPCSWPSQLICSATFIFGYSPRSSGM